MRDEFVVRDLVDRAIWDEHFRYKARFDDLEGRSARLDSGKI
jgi:hypothetical protein